MVWQDIVISIVNIVFIIALVPQIYNGFKLKKGSVIIATSLPTFIGLYVVAIVFYTLQLYYSSFVTVIGGILWTILFIQRLMYKKA
ncbi:MAG: hypothetical protein KAT91_02615 [Candidatus Aenigmarchaeota archaeon]|nr:hypothetical protein [Candidatus Aenigmarchaeota archaeon]